MTDVKIITFSITSVIIVDLLKASTLELNWMCLLCDTFWGEGDRQRKTDGHAEMERGGDTNRQRERARKRWRVREGDRYREKERGGEKPREAWRDRQREGGLDGDRDRQRE